MNDEGSIMTDETPGTHDDYIAAAPVDKRIALRRLRTHIKAAASRAEECISDRLPAFRLDGKLLVAYGATENHCAFYPMSSTVVEAFREELGSYEISAGAICFTPGNSLSAGMVKKLVKARIKENREPAEKGEE